MEDIIAGIVLLAASLFLFWISTRSFREKGFLLNNAYLYASKTERETMNKKPYYRQTAVVFLLMAIVFLLLSFAILLDAGWITWIASAVIGIIPVYALASGIAIEKKKKQP